MKEKKIFMIAALIGLTFLAYGNALFNTFVWDDKAFIVDNPYIKDFRHLPDFFLNRIDQTSPVGSGFESYYRPLFLLSFMGDYHLWGLNPFFFHLHNVLLHFLCTVLVFYFARHFLKDDFFAFSSAVFFSLHPIHTEAVSAVFNRMDVLVSCAVMG